MIDVRSPPVLLVVLLACGSRSDDTTSDASTGAAPLRPTEGLWSFGGGEVLGDDCPKGGPTIALDYVLTITGEGTFELSQPEDPDARALHSCTMAGADFECPSVELGGAGFISIAVGITGTFTREDRAVGVLSWTWHCAWIPSVPGTSSGGPPDDDELDCTDEIGDTCSMSQALAAVSAQRRRDG